MASSHENVLTIEADPYPFTFPLRSTALLVIDMQRDFLYPAGFGEIQGGNLEAVQASIAPTKALLEACRAAGMKIFHTREGHVPVCGISLLLCAIHTLWKHSLYGSQG